MLQHRCDKPAPYTEPIDLRSDSDMDCAAAWDRYVDAQYLPTWAIPLVVLLCVVTAWILHECVEEPVDGLLLNGEPPRQSAAGLRKVSAHNTNEGCYKAISEVGNGPFLFGSGFSNFTGTGNH